MYVMSVHKLLTRGIHDMLQYGLFTAELWGLREGRAKRLVR